jgi:uncharacterized protein (TIGR02217 family)
MAEFLNERLPVNIRAGASYSDTYNVEITETAEGCEFRRLVHPFPRRIFSVFYTQLNDDLQSQILSLYHRCYGMFAGFRVKAIDDYTTNGMNLAPTAHDQRMKLISAGVYQLQIAYGTGTVLDIGAPTRYIYKPVVGTVKVGIGGIVIPAMGWTVDYDYGEVTFITDKTWPITSITKGATTKIVIGAHTLSATESVHISGATGMTQINGLRGLITEVDATSITVAINSAGFNDLTGNGVIHTRPQPGEIVTGGCEFDIPCRFNQRIDVNTLSPHARETGHIEIIELLNI